MILLRKYVIVIVAMLMLQETSAQQAIDTSYKTTYYVQKTSLFKLLPHSKKDIIFLGNSITDIGEWSEIWQNKYVKNRGISSDNTFGVLARLPEVIAAKPRMIFIMIGINDIARNTPDAIIISNYNKIIKTIKKGSAKTKVFVQSILPTNNRFKEFTRHQEKQEHILHINKALQDICVRENIIYVDLHSRFVDKDGKLDEQYTNDGLHINGPGYILWKSILQEKGYLK